MTIKTRREILKEWGLIKSQKDLEIYKKIEFMTYRKKDINYGQGVLKVVVELLELEETNQARRVIKRIPSKERRLLVGDTYLAITEMYQEQKEDCEHRLINLCSETQKECTVLNCPKNPVSKNSKKNRLEITKLERELEQLLKEKRRLKEKNKPLKF